MKIMCIGDSLTFGNVGFSYIPFLAKDIVKYNRGLNGETTRGAFKRLQRILGNQRYDDMDYYIIAIGNNDILLPHLKTVSFFWKWQMDLRCRMKGCIEEDEVFAEEYEKHIRLLSEHGKKVILIGLSYFELENYPHKIVCRRNEILQDLAAKYGYPFIDIYKKQFLHSDKNSYRWGKCSFVRISDAVMMTLFPFTKDIFSKARHLKLTVDGVHYNSKSARLLSEEITKILDEQ